LLLGKKLQFIKFENLITRRQKTKQNQIKLILANGASEASSSLVLPQAGQHEENVYEK
jgi:hypothetical protein